MAKPSFAARQRRERAQQIARARRNLAAERVVFVAAAEERSNATALGGTVLVAFALHAGLAAMAWTHAPQTRTEADKVHVKVVMREPEPVLADIEHADEATKPQTPEVALPKPTQPASGKAREKRPAKSESEPEATPIPIIGLTLESTTTGGSGAAFAIGETLAGTTSQVAREPLKRSEIELAPAIATRPASASHPFERARTEPSAHVELAKRLSRVEPQYPEDLARQQIEGDVTVRVFVSASGKVESVEIVRGASERAFDQAALAAARLETFAPETHDGVPVQTSLTYTYRFRITP